MGAYIWAGGDSGRLGGALRRFSKKCKKSPQSSQKSTHPPSIAFFFLPPPDVVAQVLVGGEQCVRRVQRDLQLFWGRMGARRCQHSRLFLAPATSTGKQGALRHWAAAHSAQRPSRVPV